MITLRRAETRHHDTSRKRDVWKTFDAADRTDAFADRFGLLEALDEIRLAAGGDVHHVAGTNAELVTYVRDGALAYEDSIGHAGVIRAGEFQCIAVARGVRHSEANASRADPAQVFQIRLRPLLAVVPGREQARFSAARRRGGLCVVASSDARGGSLRIRQDARIYAALLDPGQHVVHELAPERGAWLHVVHGRVALGDLALRIGDGAGVTTERAVSLTAQTASEILLLDVGPELHLDPA